jgi:hypothetical protein
VRTTAELARVHVASWLGAYRGLLPDEVLHRLSVERAHLATAGVTVPRRARGRGRDPGLAARGQRPRRRLLPAAGMEQGGRPPRGAPLARRELRRARPDADGGALRPVGVRGGPDARVPRAWGVTRSRHIARIRPIAPAPGAFVLIWRTKAPSGRTSIPAGGISGAPKHHPARSPSLLDCFLHPVTQRHHSHRVSGTRPGSGLAGVCRPVAQARRREACGEASWHNTGPRYRHTETAPFPGETRRG